jgi:hypothetical protein
VGLVHGIGAQAIEVVAGQRLCWRADGKQRGTAHQDASHCDSLVIIPPRAPIALAVTQRQPFGQKYIAETGLAATCRLRDLPAAQPLR